MTQFRSFINNLLFGNAPIEYSKTYWDQVLNQLQTLALRQSRFMDTAEQYATPLLYSEDFTPDFQRSSYYSITPTEALQINNPSNIFGGANNLPSGTFIITQGASPFAVTFDTQYSLAASMPAAQASKSLIVLYQVVAIDKIVVNPLADYI